MRSLLSAVLAAALALVAVLTLVPAGGGGWAWGSPAVEAHWYLSGLDSGATVLQLLGNLLLLAPAAALAVVRFPALQSPAVLAVAAGTAGAGIEVLQWLLPLGRVVSPLDALLNATGALAVGLLLTALIGPGAARLRGGFVAPCRG
ncbi:VanZ like family protein [Geodermatophilus amargosae]|uniref:VanZ like family protein n=1 Tax=Geodermatophilus amargosae TaxID=1296565 RepID=A0A1I6ZE10_9ACTN|nr:VanZ family protein [Geodermatophilus amargosae]SFT60922.1 VanZ like family protein [Geodermatophilus amargosae]